jgi:hypothetical protein
LLASTQRGPANRLTVEEACLVPRKEPAYRRVRAIATFSHRGREYERGHVYEVPRAILSELLLENRVDTVERWEKIEESTRVPIPQGMPRRRAKQHPEQGAHEPLPRIEFRLGETAEDLVDGMTWARVKPGDLAIHERAEAEGKLVIRDHDGRLRPAGEMDLTAPLPKAVVTKTSPTPAPMKPAPPWLARLRLLTTTVGGTDVSLLEDDRGDDPVTRMRRVVLLNILGRERARLGLRPQPTLVYEALGGLSRDSLEKTERILEEWEPYVQARGRDLGRDLEADLRDLLDALDGFEFDLDALGQWWREPKQPRLLERRELAEGRHRAVQRTKRGMRHDETTTSQRELVILLASSMETGAIATALGAPLDRVKKAIGRLYERYAVSGAGARDELLRRFGMPRLP